MRSGRPGRTSRGVWPTYSTTAPIHSHQRCRRDRHRRAVIFSRPGSRFSSRPGSRCACCYRHRRYRIRRHHNGRRPSSAPTPRAPIKPLPNSPHGLSVATRHSLHLHAITVGHGLVRWSTLAITGEENEKNDDIPWPYPLYAPKHGV